MATGITERNKLKNELSSMGFKLDYIDSWSPKTRLYRHKPSYYENGGIAQDVGTYVDNVPGNPDYVAKKAKIGLFPWAPSDTCSCQWCRKENTNTGKGKRTMGPHFKTEES